MQALARTAAGGEEEAMVRDSPNDKVDPTGSGDTGCRHLETGADRE